MKELFRKFRKIVFRPPSENAQALLNHFEILKTLGRKSAVQEPLLVWLSELCQMTIDLETMEDVRTLRKKKARPSSRGKSVARDGDDFYSRSVRAVAKLKLDQHYYQYVLDLDRWGMFFANKQLTNRDVTLIAWLVIIPYLRSHGVTNLERPPKFLSGNSLQTGDYQDLKHFFDTGQFDPDRLARLSTPHLNASLFIQSSKFLWETRPPKWLVLSEFWMSISGILHDAGKFEDSILASRKAWSIVTSHGTSHAVACLKIAICNINAHLSAGRVNDAANVTNSVRRMTESSLFQESRVGQLYYAWLLVTIATIEVKIGRFSRAEKRLLRAQDICKSRETEFQLQKHVDPDLPDVSIAIDYYLQMVRTTKTEPKSENLRNAKQVCLRAKEAFGENSSAYLAALISYAELLSSSGNQKHAERILQIASKAQIADEGRPKFASIQAEINLAELANRIGDLPYWIGLRNRALQALGSDHEYYANACAGLAKSYLVNGSVPEACEEFQTAVNIWNKALGTLPSGAFAATAEVAVGVKLYALAEQSDQSADWIGYSVGWLAELEAARTKLIADLSRSGGSEKRLLSKLREIKNSLHIQLWFAAAGTVGDKVAEKIEPFIQHLLELTWQRKCIVSEIMSKRRSKGRIGDESFDSKDIEDIKDQTPKNSFEFYVEESPEKFMERLGKQLEIEERKFRSYCLFELDAGLNVGHAALIEFLRVDSVDVGTGFSMGEPKYIAFVCATDGHGDLKTSLVNLGEADAIDRLVRGYRKGIVEDAAKNATESGCPSDSVISTSSSCEKNRGISFGRKSNSPSTIGAKLRAKVFDPLIPYFESATRIFIAPDGELLLLPFETLPIDERFVIDDYTISYCDTIYSVIHHEDRAPSQNPSVVIGGVDYGSVSNHDSDQASNDAHRKAFSSLRANYQFAPIDGTREESLVIGQILGASPIMGDAANIATMRALRGPGVLHIATHSYFLPWESSTDEQKLNPLLRSGLALSGANIASLEPPGILTAQDVTELDLDGTQMVVLSACETGVGEIESGEGVFGFRRAFFLAGAETLVTSMWVVPDQATSLLMGEFYEHLEHSDDCASALRTAQLRVRQVYPKPFAWGSFVCQGNPKPLELRSPGV